MPTLYIDADACAVIREAVSAARALRVPVVLVAGESHDLSKWAGHVGVSIVQVAKGRDAADFAMVPLLAPGDVVVTDDTGLAAIALARGAKAVTSRGRIFSPATIDIELEVRHAEQRHRRSGGRTGGHTAFGREDRTRFADSLLRLFRPESSSHP